MKIENSTEEKSIIFLCKCSLNISNRIDFEEIKKWIRKNNKADLIVEGNLLCSPKEKENMEKLLKGNNKYLNHKKVKSIVIAACSPKLHELTFQNIAEKVGINMSRVVMANIREQCAWVTKDIGDATDKAKALINAAVKLRCSHYRWRNRRNKSGIDDVPCRT